MLKFYDDGHIYELDGKEIPSVSEILRFMSREIYGEISKYILDNAAERGTAIHKATQDIDTTGSCEIEPAYIGYVQAYAAFVRDHTVKWELIETPLADRKLWYAGTLDRYGMVDDVKCIVDLKSNGVVKKPLVKPQLNAYSNLIAANGYEAPEKLYCLQLMSIGTYRLYEVKFGMEEFMSCLTIHKCLEKKHRRLMIE